MQQELHSVCDPIAIDVPEAEEIRIFAFLGARGVSYCFRLCDAPTVHCDG